MVLPNPAAANSAESSSACWALMVRAVVTELSRKSNRSGAASA
ncbi:Uncharacterised protein [Mycobacterium tuberculosis]|uniref:Uncharacterized protein n=1 Tax=Mycobacterium tuberculosis TaxID=1773 RepID=A0A655JMV4_MYCTX|nr:Uncharacterised protein [Mycobacterium tuberculosis]COW81174.1 Uncharacterised protein [Mycobacterium tuberculosis]COX23731.1 Uncharacterised protein [Mycobacterium tuberculosis]COX24587.1 Uncharacterised protein [Mycobacterium tuberculosis]